jgi:photosystem II stability/assembly factor-like uncharacterized protein
MKKSFLRLGIFFAAFLLIGQGCVSSSGSNTNVGPGGMFVSVDKGESWQSISLLPSLSGTKDLSSASVYRLFEDPQDSKAMYWATRNNGMLFSYDDGASWQQPKGPLSTGFIYGVAVHPKDKCTIYVTNGSFVYKSVDCNRSWVEIHRDSVGSRITSIAVNPFPPHQIYITKNNGNILESEDAGISWKIKYYLGERIIDIFADPHVENRFFISTENMGIFRSVDSGARWEALDDQLKEFSGGLEYRRFVLSAAEPDLLYYVSTYGIHISEDGGNSWVTPNLIHPPGSARIFGFAVNPNNTKEMYYTATINERSTFYKTIDGGENWITKKLPSGQIPTALRVHPEKNDWIYLGFTAPITE